MHKRRRSAAEMHQVVDQYLQGQQTMATFCSMQLPISVVHPLPAGIPFLGALSDEADQFGDAYAGGAQGNWQGVVERVGCPVDHALEGAGMLFFRLAQPVPDVAGQISDAETEVGQAIDGDDCLRPAGGGRERPRVHSGPELWEGRARRP